MPYYGSRTYSFSKSPPFDTRWKALASMLNYNIIATKNGVRERLPGEFDKLTAAGNAGSLRGYVHDGRSIIAIDNIWAELCKEQIVFDKFFES